MSLIHSMSLFSHLYLDILQLVNAKNICEIGSETGGNTSVLLSYVKEHFGKLTCIDTNPDENFYQSTIAEGDLVFLKGTSLDHILNIENIDGWFVDGDHNWYTVYNELSLIRQSVLRDGGYFLAFVHDVDWPCAYRDLYYNPDRIPPAFRHPHRWDMGTTLDKAELVKGGFRGEGSFALACHSGGERNGVRRAIEDFLAENADFPLCFSSVPGVFGLGIIFGEDEVNAPQIKRRLLHIVDNPLLAELERNRLLNYLRVIELQDQATQS